MAAAPEVQHQSRKGKFEMKRGIVIALAVLLVVATGIFAFADSVVKIFVDEKQLDTTVAPSIQNGSTVASVRDIAEALGASVMWDAETKSVRIESDKNDMRITLLEQALIPQDHLVAANTWAEAIKMRNGALQYALLTPSLQSEKYEEYVALNWVTGTSSPWVKDYTVTEKGKLKEDAYLYLIEYVYTDSTQSTSKMYEYITVVKSDTGWKVSSLDPISVSGKITEVTTNDKGEVISVFVEGTVDGIGIYDKAKVLIGPNTKIYKGYSSLELKAEDLVKGLSVEVTFVDGPMIMIYPPQAQAKIIRIMD